MTQNAFNIFERMFKSKQMFFKNK